jgi:DNA-binding winged helix-turn-helix (wHTH) protein
MLLERPGKMGTREELRAKLWATDTFVDFDHGLNSAVQRLRDCLSDSAGKPLWVETIPRRGYRFVGQVEWSDEGFSSEILSPAVNFAGSMHNLDVRKRPSAIWKSLTGSARLTWCSCRTSQILISCIPIRATALP